MTKKISTPEDDFAQVFQLTAQTCGCVWVKIPDYIVTSKTRHIPKKKLPCDGILVMPEGVMLIELKYGYNDAEDHQIDWSAKCRKVNTLSYVFVRMRPATKTIPEHYRIETSDGGKPRLIETFDSLKSLIHQLQSVLIVNSNSTELQELIKRRYQ